MSESKRERQEREQHELDEALAAWVEDQSHRNTHQLYRKACAYLGVVPIVAGCAPVDGTPPPLRNDDETPF